MIKMYYDLLQTMKQIWFIRKHENCCRKKSADIIVQAVLVISRVHDMKWTSRVGKIMISG